MATPYHLAIPGTVVVVGKEPDGDSVRFVADRPELFAELRNGHRITLSKDGSVQLRLEGVDAPELHYGNDEQPLGDRARDRLLRWLGFSHLQYAPGTTVVEHAEPESVRGLVLSKAAEAHGRPVSFLLLADDAPGIAAGSWTEITPQLMRRTLNARLLQSGVAYLTAYTSTPLIPDLRRLALQARNAGRGVWAADSTAHFKLVDQQSIGAHGALILPKLFRRCTDYLKAVSTGFHGNLVDWILDVSKSPTRNENDAVVVCGLELHLSDLIEQRNRTIVFQPDTLDVVFVEK